MIDTGLSIAFLAFDNCRDDRIWTGHGYRGRSPLILSGNNLENQLNGSMNRNVV